MRILILFAVVAVIGGCTLPSKHAVQAEPGQKITIKERSPSFTERLKGHFARKPKVEGTSLSEAWLRP